MKSPWKAACDPRIFYLWYRLSKPLNRVTSAKCHMQIEECCNRQYRLCHMQFGWTTRLEKKLAQNNLYVLFLKSVRSTIMHGMRIMVWGEFPNLLWKVWMPILVGNSQVLLSKNAKAPVILVLGSGVLPLVGSWLTDRRASETRVQMVRNWPARNLGSVAFLAKY